MTLRQQIGSRIRAKRLRLDLTQEQVAAAVGVSDGAVCSWEKGDSLPGTKHLAAIAKELGVSIDWLLMGAAMEHDPPPRPEDQELTEDEIKLLLAYRKAAPNRKAIAMEILQAPHGKKKES